MLELSIEQVIFVFRGRYGLKTCGADRIERSVVVVAMNKVINFTHSTPPRQILPSKSIWEADPESSSCYPTLKGRIFRVAGEARSGTGQEGEVNRIYAGRRSLSLEIERNCGRAICRGSFACFRHGGIRAFVAGNAVFGAYLCKHRFAARITRERGY